MNVEFTRAAVQDLARLREFIARKDPDTAPEVAARLAGAIRNLARAPRMGRIVEDMPGNVAHEVREFVFGRYVVRYTLAPPPVAQDHPHPPETTPRPSLVVLRVWHVREER